MSVVGSSPTGAPPPQPGSAAVAPDGSAGHGLAAV